MQSVWVRTAVVVVILVVTDGKRSEGSRRMSVNRYDELRDANAVVTTMCDVRCRDRVIAAREQCHRRCLNSHEPKPGSCPSSFQQISIFAKACLKICSHDYQCAHTEKCCEHSCGVTCQPAQGLHEAAFLPDVPINITAKETNDNNVVQIQWIFPSTGLLDRNTLYLIENRSHLGKFFDEDSLGPWTPFYQANENPTIVRGLVMTAHWYIFRVAAINSNGTKGFSEPSKPLFISKVPAKPGPPRGVYVTNVREVNDTVWGEVRWKKPKSDIPIKRYKVFWSQRLPGHHPKNVSESVLRHQRTLPKNCPRLELKNLQKNDFYYIQVQAIARFGNEQLRGEKAELFFNTTQLQDQFASPVKSKHHKKLRIATKS